MKGYGSIISQIILAYSLISAEAFSQVPASKEPRHKNVFENNYLRILDVKIEPGDTTLYHRHSLPSAIVFFTNTNTGSQIIGDNLVDGHSVAGETIFAAFGEKPIVHRVWNRDTVLYHVMDIELLFSPANHAEALPKRKDRTPAWDQKIVRAYKITVQPDQSLPRLTSKMPMLLISISGSELSVSRTETNGDLMKLIPGTFVWIKPGQKLLLKNQGKLNTNCILIELKSGGS